MRKTKFLTGIAFAILTMASLSSCCNGADDLNNSDIPVVVPADSGSDNTQGVQNINVPAGYTSGLYTGNDGNTYLVKTDNGMQDGSLDKIYIIPNSGNPSSGKYAVAMFANNQIRSITLDNVTYVFGVNANGKIDVAVISGNNTELFTDVADGSLLTNVKGDMYAETLAKAFLSYEDMLNIIKIVNQMIDENSKLKDAVEGADSLRGDIANNLDNSGVTDKDKLDGALSQEPTDIPTTISQDDVNQRDSTIIDDTNRGNGAIISGKGALKVTLTWFYGADIDLHVYEPQYEVSRGHIYYFQKTNSFCGGFLDIDNTVGYYIEPSTGITYKNLAAVENIFWKENPDNGNYRVYLNYYGGMESGNCNVTIFVNGKSIYETNVFVDRRYKDEMLFIGTVKMPEGTFAPATSQSVNNSQNSKGYKPFVCEDPKTFPAKK